MRGLDFFSQTFLFLFPFFYFLSWVPWFYYYWWMMGSMRWKRTWGSYLQKPWSFFTLSSPLFPWSSDLDLYLFIYQSFFNGNWQLRTANCLCTTVYESPPLLLSSWSMPRNIDGSCRFDSLFFGALLSLLLVRRKTKSREQAYKDDDDEKALWKSEERV